MAMLHGLLSPALSASLPLVRRGGRPLGRRGRRCFAALSEVLEAANENDGAPPETSAPTKEAVQSTKGREGQQGVLWFSNIYPTKIARFDFRQVLTHHNHETLIPKLLPEGVEVLHMVPREREGGAFVWFYAPPAFCQQVSLKLKEKALKELGGEDALEAETHGRQMRSKLQRRLERQAANEDALGKVMTGISSYLKKNQVRAFLCPLPVRAHRVEGEPYLEDMDRYPGSRLRIRVEGGESAVREEQLFKRLRRYGELADIEALPKGEGFRATFRFAAAAIAARNCLHRARIDPDKVLATDEVPTEFKIEFEAFMRKWLQDAFLNNARIAIPALILVMVSTTYFIWDPMRTTAVQLRVAGALRQDAPSDERIAPRYHFSGLWGKFLNAWSSWSNAQATMASTFGGKSWSFLTSLGQSRDRSRSLLEDFWSGRNQEMVELRQWLKEPQDRVMLLTGPRGNGQGELVRYLLDGGGSRGAVFIDVSEMLDQSSDEQVFLRRLCRAFGYAPAPLAERHLSAMLDLAMPGSGKLNRSNEVTSTVQRVLSCTTQALIDMRARRRRVSGAAEASQDQVTGIPAPLFVVDGFTAENKDRHAGFFELLVSWAAYVTDNNLARVLFIADSSFAEPTMLAALKNRPEKLEVQQLRDADRHSVRALLERHLGSDNAAELTAEDLAAIGGRFRDVASLVAHVKEGSQPAEAVRRLVEAAAMTVRTLLVYGQADTRWTRPQLWRAVRLLATAGPEGVPHDLFLWTVFRGDEVALRSMLQSNLITVSQGADNGNERDDDGMLRRRMVQPGSPIYAEVYRRLIRHAGHSAVLDLEVAKEDIKREQDKITEYEIQLVRLQEVDDVMHDKGRGLPDPNQALLARKEQLLGLIEEQHKKLKSFHAARLKASAVLSSLKEAKPIAAPQTRQAERPRFVIGLWGVAIAAAVFKWVGT